MAAVYEQDIYPLFGKHLDQLLAPNIRKSPAARVLEMGCANGVTTATLLRLFDQDSSICAVDNSRRLSSLFDNRLARLRRGRDLSFTVQAESEPLPFPDNQFNAVVSKQVLSELNQPDEALRELDRVCAAGGLINLATTVQGSWAEPLDLLAESLWAEGNAQARSALERYRDKLLPAESLASRFEALGLGEVEVEVKSWEILFKSAREFFFAPVIEFGPLMHWKRLVAETERAQAVFNDMRSRIDTYFRNGVFVSTVVAARISGRKAA